MRVMNQEASSRGRGFPVSGFGKAFTLVELLVVVGIIGVLIAILVPTLSVAREAAVGTKGLSNLRPLESAFIQYATQNRDIALLGLYSSQKPTDYLIHYNEVPDLTEIASADRA